MLKIDDGVKKTLKMPENGLSDMVADFNKVHASQGALYDKGADHFKLYAPTEASDMFNAQDNASIEEQGRTPKIYNYVPKFVEGIASNLMVNVGDPQYQCRKKGKEGAVTSLQKKYFHDKDTFSYDVSGMSALVDGCIWRGVEEIRITPTENDVLGAIEFKRIDPLSVFFDPDTKEDDIALDSQKAWRVYHMNPDAIVAKWPHAKKELEANMSDNVEYDGTQTTTPQVDASKWGSKYRVIEHYYIKNTETKSVFYKPLGITFPKTNHEYGSMEEVEEISKWFEEKYKQPIDHNETKDIVSYKQELVLCIFMPDYNILLEHNLDRRQIPNGKGGVRLPFFMWAYVMKNGTTSDIVDSIKDVQEDINQRESQKTKVFTSGLMADKLIISDNLFPDGAAEKKKFVEDLNDVSRPSFTHKDIPHNQLGKYIERIPATQINASLFHEEASKIAMMGDIARLSPAMSGQAERSGESNRLYRSKVYESTMMLKIPAMRLHAYNRQKHIAYASLAIDIYGGKTECERLANQDNAFLSPDGTETILNHKTKDGIENDLYSLSRSDFAITVVKNSESYKDYRRAQLTDEMAVINPAIATNLLYYAQLMGELMEITQDESTESAQTVKDYKGLITRVATKELLAKEIQLDQAIANASAQMQGGIPPTEKQPVGISPMAKQGETNEQTRPA